MKVVEHNKSFRMMVKGDSMRPTIMENSYVTIEDVHPDHIKIGDVVVFKICNKIFIHRIIGIHKIKKDLFFVEKGDNLLVPTSIFPGENLLGKVSNIENKNIGNFYNKNFIYIYLLSTYPLFKAFQIVRQLLGKKSKKLESVFNFYLVIYRFFSIFPYYFSNKN